jgi:putative transcriptional regulator
MKNLSPQHHPDTNLLLEFASGSIDHGQSIAISAHLHYCAECRSKVMEFERIGGAMMANHTHNTTGHTVNNNIDSNINHHESNQSFNQLMDKIQQREATPHLTVTPQESHSHHPELPTAVRKMLHPTTHWKRMTSSLRAAGLIAGQDKYGVSLQKIQAGGKVPQHDHRGSEITVVLKGSFSDEDGVYQQGDFLMKNEGDIHSPMASKNQDCLCLSVEQAPVKLTSLFGRLLINPFLRIRAL